MIVCLFNPPNLKNRIVSPDDYYSWIYREKSVSLFNYVCPPYTLCQLSSLIKRDLLGVDVRVFDSRLSHSIEPEIILRTIREEYKPDLIVMLLGAYTLNHDIKYVPKDITTIGVICPLDVSPELAMRFHDISRIKYWVKNELERTILSTIENFKRSGAIDSTPGLLVSEGQDLRDTGDSKPYPLRELPVPDYDAVPMEEYFRLLSSDFSFKRTYFDSDRYATVFNNKGCVFSCRFCNLGIGHYDYKQPSQIIAEMRYFIERHSCNNFVFMGNEFTGNAEIAKATCQAIIESGLKAKWSSGDRVEFIDEELIYLMAKSGCCCLVFGVETADPRLREKFNRMQSNEQFKKVFGWCRKYGILTYANIIGGLVGEDEETVKYNVELIKSAKPDRISMHYFFVAPGSDFYFELLNNNALRHHDWSRYYWYWTDKEVLYFSHNRYKTYAELIETADSQGRKLRRAIYLRKLKDTRGIKRLAYMIPYIKNSEFFEKVIASNLRDDPLYYRLERWLRRHLQ